MEPIVLYFSGEAFNPWKVVMIFEELDLPYTLKSIAWADVKERELTTVNPNGRVPVIVDPNTNVTLWESGAIMEYLVEQYDKKGRISYDTLIERNLTRQFLHFQMSGQGPPTGQAVWFMMFHPEKLPSVIERFQNETKRVAEVLNGILEKNGTGWLVGDKCTYADLSFYLWGLAKDMAWPEKWNNADVPHYTAWLERIGQRPATKKTMEVRAQNS
ncbi:glutathione S-transferase [Teratosphaeria destructans]|uniref:Glutathione S-transferase n=1 Tax=Teratosphaeria destructans TaxID=418781 RepID=A0A9W7T0J5_9PEZI|nr:glutathione S-transferase [Teratosphaeria destructans]